MSLNSPLKILQMFLPTDTSKDKKLSQISTLPDEIIELILEFMSIKDLASISRVNHDFNALSNKEHLWKSICFREGVTEQPISNGKPLSWKITLKRGRWRWDYSDQFSSLYSKEIKVYDNNIAVNCFTASNSTWKTMRTTHPLQNTKIRSSFGIEIVTFGQYFYVVVGLSTDDFDYTPHASRQVHSEGCGDYYSSKLKQKDIVGFVVEDDTITWYFKGEITKSEKLDPNKVWYPSVSLVHQTIIRIIPNWKPTLKSI